MDERNISIYIGSKIKHFRQELGLTQKELAQKIGMGATTVTNYEKGFRTPKKDSLFKLADVLNVSIDDLFPPIEKLSEPSPTSTLTLITETSSKLDEVRQEEVLEFAEEKLEEQEKQADNNVDEIHETLYPYTVTEKIAAASGLPHGYSYDQDQNETFTLYSDKFITKAYDIASQVTGNSMEPNYHDGDVVLIKKGYDNINGSIYVVDYDGKTYLKKLYLEENHFRLVSINDTYDDIIIDLPVDESLYFNIVGKVIDSFTPVEG